MGVGGFRRAGEFARAPSGKAEKFFREIKM